MINLNKMKGRINFTSEKEVFSNLFLTKIIILRTYKVISLSYNKLNP